MKVEITVNKTSELTREQFLEDLKKEIEKNVEYRKRYYVNDQLNPEALETEYKNYVSNQEKLKAIQANDPKEITEAITKTIIRDNEEIEVKVYTIDAKIFEKCRSVMELIQVQEDFYRIKLEQEGSAPDELEKVEIPYSEIYSSDFEIFLRYLILKQDSKFEEKHKDTDFEISSIGINEDNVVSILNLIQFIGYDECDIFNDKIEDKTEVTMNEAEEQTEEGNEPMEQEPIAIGE